MEGVLRPSGVALLEGLAARLVVVVAEVDGCAGVVAELDVHVLKGIVGRIVALEGQESSRGAHGTDRAHEGNALAGVEECAGGVRMDGHIQFLDHEGVVGLLGVGHGPEPLLHVQEL